MKTAPIINRRYATPDRFIIRPWVEIHGYGQNTAERGKKSGERSD
jgi:hypothetical protein